MTELTPQNQTLVDAFARRFVEAVGNQSHKDLAELCVSKDDRKRLAASPPLNDPFFTAAIRMGQRKLCQAFLLEKKGFIERKNAKPASALTVANISHVTAKEIVTDEGVPGERIPMLVIHMQEHGQDKEYALTTRFGVKDVFIFDETVRVGDILSTKTRVSSREAVDLYPEYPVLTKEAFAEMLTPHIGKSDADTLNHGDWRVHSGDLDLETYDLLRPLVITGNLTVREPMMTVDAGLIVLGRTTVNALQLMDANDVILAGGVDFAVAAFSCISGPTKILKNPSGPFLYAACESTIVEGSSEVGCYVNTMYPEDSHGDLRATVASRFITVYQDDDYEDVDLDGLWSAIRSGDSIFRSEGDEPSPPSAAPVASDQSADPGQSKSRRSIFKALWSGGRKPK